MPGSEPIPRNTSVSWKDICLHFSGLSGEYRQGDRLVPPGSTWRLLEKSPHAALGSQASLPQRPSDRPKPYRVRAGGRAASGGRHQTLYTCSTSSLFCYRKRQHFPASISSVGGKGGHGRREHSGSVSLATPFPSCVEHLCPNQSKYYR